MSSFWGLWVGCLMLLNLGITVFLLIWGRASRSQPWRTAPRVMYGRTACCESVRRLPAWWMILSVGTFVVGGIYFLLLSRIRHFQGTSGLD